MNARTLCVSHAPLPSDAAWIEDAAAEKNGRGWLPAVDTRLRAARGLQLSEEVADDNWAAQVDEVVVLSSIFRDDFRGEDRSAGDDVLRTAIG